MNKAIIGCAVVAGITVVAGIKARIKKNKEILAEKSAITPNPSEPKEANMEFDYHAYPTVIRNRDGIDVRYDRMARVEIAGVNVYMDAEHAKRYGLMYAAPEEVPEFITTTWLDAQQENGHGPYVYLMDLADRDVVAVALSVVPDIATVMLRGEGDYMRWENGVRVR